MKLWGDGSETGEALLDEFNASIGFDRVLFREDIAGSIAHARMLAKQGIIGKEDAAAIESGLRRIEGEIERGEFVFAAEDEDIHMAVERRLTALIGEAGKRLHTARSRNDQVALDFRLWCVRQGRHLADLVAGLVSALHETALKHTETLMPGMTHLQHAQPISLAYYLLAYMSMLVRDHDRLMGSAKRANLSPLGSAALAGTPHPIDRAFVAAELGFDGVTLNGLDSVSDRDFALELLFNAAAAMMHLSRFCEELVLWSSAEFRFVRIADRFTTGSSIMPQKRNPDAAELIRGKTGRVYGSLMGLLTVMKGTPLAYNKDMQEDKEGVFDAVKTLSDSLTILTAMLQDEGTVFDREVMRAACARGHLSATDLADAAAQKGVPFREAHHLARRAASLADQKGIDLSMLKAEDLALIDPRLEGLTDALSLEASMNARVSAGGTAKSAVLDQLSFIEGWIKSVHLVKSPQPAGRP
ncbi:MAG: argininosuccinate lyase [Helicobacteraceae bacterium]|nr:argininosuccinate lyase [Helicobacteraceae bacterium]